MKTSGPKIAQFSTQNMSQIEKKVTIFSKMLKATT